MNDDDDGRILDDAMTTTTLHFGETKPIADLRSEPTQNLRLRRVSAHIVAMPTLFLELKSGRSLFEVEPQPGHCERHPELYIG